MPGRLPGLTALLACAALLGVALPRIAAAETIVVDDKVEVQDSEVPRPARGATMKSVEARFGSPSARHPTVGKPPITRWDYPDFSVFFEGDRVIHAVALR